jgi:hypothetical protein
MRIRQCDRREFLARQKRDVISPAQQWSDIVGLPCCLDRANTKRTVDALKLPKLVVDQRFQGQEEEYSAPVESTAHCGKLAEHRLSRRSRRRLAPKNARLIDGVQLQLIKPRNVPGPCVNHRLRESKARKAANFSGRDRPAPVGESGTIHCPRRHNRPAKFAIEGPAHRGMLLPANLPCGIDNAPDDIIEQAQESDSIPFTDFFRPLQRFK